MNIPMITSQVNSLESCNRLAGNRYWRYCIKWWHYPFAHRELVSEEACHVAHVRPKQTAGNRRKSRCHKYLPSCVRVCIRFSTKRCRQWPVTCVTSGGSMFKITVCRARLSGLGRLGHLLGTCMDFGSVPIDFMPHYTISGRALSYDWWASFVAVKISIDDDSGVGYRFSTTMIKMFLTEAAISGR